MKRLIAICAVVTLMCLTSGAMADLFVSVAPGSAANGWNTTPVNLSAPGVLDWYVANNTNWGETYHDPDPTPPDTSIWDWTHTYTAPGNEKAGASILSNYNLGYTGSGYTGGHTIDTTNKVLFSYTDGVSPTSETDTLARTNWMTDLNANGIMSLRADVGNRQLYLTQWFNYSDEWEASPKGHTLTATLYDAANVQQSQEVWSAPSGLSAGFINLYTATIGVQGGNAGDYLILEHSTSNIGYRGTMVAVPVPAAVLLGMLGLGAAGLKLRRLL